MAVSRVGEGITVGLLGSGASPVSMCGYGGDEEAQYHLRISESRAQVPVHSLTAIEGTQLVYMPHSYGESSELEQQPTADMDVMK